MLPGVMQLQVAPESSSWARMASQSSFSRGRLAVNASSQKGKFVRWWVRCNATISPMMWAVERNR